MSDNMYKWHHCYCLTSSNCFYVWFQFIWTDFWPQVLVTGEVYAQTDRHFSNSVPGFMEVLMSLPESVTKGATVIDLRRDAVFYKLKLYNFNSVVKVFSAKLDTKKCSEKKPGKNFETKIHIAALIEKLETMFCWSLMLYLSPSSCWNEHYKTYCHTRPLNVFVCLPGEHEGSVMRFHVPWSNEDTFSSFK